MIAPETNSQKCETLQMLNETLRQDRETMAAWMRFWRLLAILFGAGFFGLSTALYSL